MGYPYGPQQSQDPYAGGYAQPGYAADPYAQQGYAAQPYGYGQQPYAAPGYEYGYGAPAYAAPQRAGGGTGITAALLSLLISLFALIGLGVIAAAELSTESIGADDDARAGTIAGLAIASVPALLWLLGSILLFRRKTAGRVILIILSTIGLLISAISVAVSAGEGAPPALVAGSVVATCIPLLILVCASAPSTGRWIRAARRSAYPAYPYY
ncbi:hypothetical protein [Nocardia sp. MW-W600-9]